ncbi:MAG: hypothetical protein HUU57_10465 [Bdellovibrio sp.]|nr:hypothetical protein [Bdellovibrio sp.]
MNKAAILIYLIFFSVFQSARVNADSSATTSSEKTIFADALLSKLPGGFQGILYNCEPLCRFLAIKIDQTWNPPLNKIKISIEKPSWVLQSDPLYPLLVESLPVEPFVLAHLTHEKVLQKTEKTVLVPPPVPFDYGYSFLFGLRGLSSQIQSSSVAQENISPTSLIQSPSVQISLFRLKPLRFLQQWLQLRAHYGSEFSGASAISTGAKINQLATDMYFDTLIMKEQYKWMVRLGKTSTSYNTDVNVLNSYSFRETWTWVGLGYLYKRFQITADYGLAVDLNEEQAFRGPLSSANFYRISTQWCAATSEVFDIKYGFCVNLSKKTSSIISGLLSDLPTSDNFNVQTDENQLQLLLRFGDDFYL